MHLKFRKQVNKINSKYLDTSDMVTARRVLSKPYNSSAQEIEEAKEYAISLFKDVWYMPIEFEVHEIVYQADIGSSEYMNYHFNFNGEEDFQPLVQVDSIHKPMMVPYKESSTNWANLLPNRYKITDRPILWAGQVFAAVLRNDLRRTDLDPNVVKKPHYNKELGTYEEYYSCVYFANKAMVLDSIQTYRPELITFNDAKLLETLESNKYVYICNSDICERTSSLDTKILKKNLNEMDADEYEEANIQNPVIRPMSLEKWVSSWGLQYLEKKFGIKDTRIKVFKGKKDQKQIDAIMSALAG